ncbi:hypothetical protein [Yoonia sp. SDW83-1]|uniref:hypothetical protein n=1 Tax=Yoonia sp. SDW83-1 TaxID=3366945 RepID=UPI00398C29EC
MKTIELVLTKREADALHEVDSEFARLLQHYHASLHALEMSEQDGTDELSLFRLHKDYDHAKEAMERFFRELD